MSSRHRAPLESRVYVPAAGEASDVELMPAGDVTDGVVRVGGTIRRPHQPQSLAVAEYLDWLEDAGFEGAPRFLGRDAQGRDVLTFLPGQCAGARPGSLGTVRGSPGLRGAACCGACTPRRPASCRGPTRSRPGRSGRTRPTPPGSCHLDVTPQNVVVRDGRGRGTGGLRPRRTRHGTSRIRFNTAMHWVPLRDPADAWPGWEATDPFRAAAHLRRRLRLERRRTTPAARRSGSRPPR